ncbi:MAG: hypothetical protein J6Q98_00255 [Bacteroidaceae bacterium]|nr:hypothetical protein [Bacteroidaceae bacterium]
MESIIAIVILGIVYSIVFTLRSAMSKNADVKARPVMQEAFPQIEILESEEPADNVTPTVVEQTPVGKAASRGTISVNRPLAVSETSLIPFQGKEKRFRLKGKTEAKRAFIYSEIFNRKY